MKIHGLILLANIICLQVQSQSTVSPSTAQERMDGISKRKSLKENSYFNNLNFRNVGPTVMSGRAVDVDVNPDNPTEFYVAYASGGLWHTTNNGQSFEPLFDNEDVITIGDIAVDWKTRKIWVGTGEVNSSRSSYAGNGIYVSADSGKTWMYKGLPESHHIGKICLHPTQSGTAWVAVLGHLYSPNKDRGVYKTTDGGNTWKQVLAIDENTGAVDLAMDPGNPDILFSVMWHRERRAWNFVESGATSGIYKSTDGGEHWSLLTTESSGFPVGEGVGRIGLAIYPKNSQILYAVLDNQAKRKDDEKADTSVIVAKQLKGISKSDFLALNDSKLEKFFRSNGFPAKYTGAVVKDLVKKDSIQTEAIVDYLNDANNSLFDTPIIGAEVYRSENGGKTWKKTHDNIIKNLCYSYGYYFGRISVSPLDDKKILVCGLPLIMSTDGGKTFKNISGDNTHGDHHAVWMDEKQDKHMIICNDGGVNITYDDGTHWFKANTPPVGQFYSVNVDMAKPYNVYGGLQDNGVWTGSSQTNNSTSWTESGQYPYKFIMGGDGMQVQVDTRDNATVYTGFQFGYYFRLNKNEADNSVPVKPENDLGEANFRFNWQTPILLSSHNQDIFYLGSNRFHRSMNKGEGIKTISQDLTLNDKKGDVPFNTIVTMSESPSRFGLLYVGTDDGLVWVSSDDGYTWKKISDGLPQGLYVSRVIASQHKENKVYVTLNGYRNDNFKPYVFVSENGGGIWKNITSNLPDEPVNVIREDPSSENIIYVGTDNGAYCSLNAGQNWMTLGGNLPRVAVHDMVVQSRENELVLGTHGRSIYITPLKDIQMLSDSVLQSALHMFSIEPMSWSKSWGTKPDEFSEPESPSLSLSFFKKKSGVVSLSITTESGVLIKTLKDSSEAGLNYVTYDLSIDSMELKNVKRSFAKQKVNIEAGENGVSYLPAGKYKLKISDSEGANDSASFEIKDPEKDKSNSQEPEARESEENEVK
ncbi:MAG: glycosyl hydrolase [Bacteroidia bacterium]